MVSTMNAEKASQVARACLDLYEEGWLIVPAADFVAAVITATQNTIDAFYIRRLSNGQGYYMMEGNR